MKKMFTMFVVTAMVLSLVAVAFAAQYIGDVKSIDPKTSEIVVRPDDYKAKGQPARVKVFLNKTAFSMIQSGYNSAKAKGKGIKVNATCFTKGNKNVAKRILIIPGGC